MRRAGVSGGIQQPDERPKARRYNPQGPAGADPRFPSPVVPELQPAPFPADLAAPAVVPGSSRPRLEQPSGLVARFSLWSRELADWLTEGDETWGVERKLNVRLILISAVVAAMLAAGLPLWHRYQLSLQGSALLAQATHHEALQEWEGAADYCWRYVALTGDPGANRRAAENFDKAASSAGAKRRAIEMYLLAVAHQEDPALRLRIAQLAFEQGDDRLALEQLERTTAQEDESEHTAERARLRALAMYRLARLGSGIVAWGDVAKELERYLLINRTNDLLSLLLADLYRNDLRDRPAEECDKSADLVMDRLVKADESLAIGWLARHAYRLRYNLPGAADDLERAQSLAPQDPAVLQAAARWAVAQGDYASAAERFEQLAAQLPDQSDNYLAWGEALIRSGRPDAAIDIWTKAAEKTLSGLPGLLVRLAEAKLERRDVAGAESLLYRADVALQSLPADTTARDAALWRIGLAAGQARLRFFQGEYAAARDLWQQLLNSPSAISLPEAAAQRTEWLGGLAECHVQLGQAEQALSLFKEAAVLRPDDPAQAIRAALAYERAGQLQLANDWFQQAVQLDANLGDAWAGLTRIELARQAQVPLAARRWEEFNERLRGLRLHQGGTLLARLLWAQHLSLSDKAPQGLALLERSATEAPESETTARSWMIAADQWGSRDDSERAWKYYVDKFGQTAWAQQVEARLLVQTGRHAEAISGLWSAARKAEPAQRDALVKTAAALTVRHEGMEAAIGALREFCLASGTLESWRLLCELHLDAGNFQEVAQIEPRLQAREGDAGVLWRYFQAQRLLATGDLANPDQLAAIDRLSRGIEDVAAGWPPGIFLRGRLAMRRGLLEQAIPLYESALRAGERAPLVWQELITALYRTGRIEQAGQYLQQMEAGAGRAESLGEVAVDVYLKQGEMSRALELAKAELARHPSDLAAHLWHAQTLYLSGQENAGLAAHFQALALFPSDTRCWTSLHKLLLDAGRCDLDEKLIEQADAATELEPGWRLAFAAKGRADLGQNYEAARRWRQFIEQFADHTQGLREAADFFVERDPMTAIAVWRRVTNLQPDDSLTRRKLAAALAAGHADAKWDEIEALLVNLPNGAEPEMEDRRQWAQALSERGRPEDLAMAKEQLEIVAEDRRQARTEDHISLSLLYRGLSDEPAAIQAVGRLLNHDPFDSAALACKAETELHFGAWQDASETLKALATAHPESLDLLRLMPVWLQKNNRETEIAPWIEEFLAQPEISQASADQRAGALVAAAESCAKLGNAKWAEQRFRQAMELAPSRAIVLAEWLIAQERSADAVTACLSAAEKGSSEAAVKLCLLLRKADANEATRRRVREALGALTAQSTDAALCSAAASWFGQTDDTAAAIALCRQALTLADGDSSATACLVLLLALDPADADEAGKALDRAFVIAGRRPPLYDAQGALLLAQGEAAKALKKFDEALVMAKLTAGIDGSEKARYELHRAAALAELGQSAAAGQALAQSRQQGLAEMALLPVERKWLARLAGTP